MARAKRRLWSIPATLRSSMACRSWVLTNTLETWCGKCLPMQRCGSGSGLGVRPRAAWFAAHLPPESSRSPIALVSGLGTLSSSTCPTSRPAEVAATAKACRPRSTPVKPPAASGWCRAAG